MDESVRIDIIKVLSDASSMIEKNDVYGLKEVSNHTIHNSSIFQDEDSVSIAVVMYTLGKIFERERKVDKSIVSIINHAKKNLIEKNMGTYRKTVRRLYGIIKQRDSKHKLYIQEVLRQAGVRKGSKIYEHGVSFAQAANILGVSYWEMMDYVGSTKIADKFKEPVNIRDRLDNARKIFGG